MFNILIQYFKRKCAPLQYWDGFEWRVQEPLEKIIIIPNN